MRFTGSEVIMLGRRVTPQEWEAGDQRLQLPVGTLIAETGCRPELMPAQLFEASGGELETVTFRQVEEMSNFAAAYVYEVVEYASNNDKPACQLVWPARHNGSVPLPLVPQRREAFSDGDK